MTLAKKVSDRKAFGAHAPALALPEGSALSLDQIIGVFEGAQRREESISLGYELTSFRLLDGGQVYYDRGIKPLLLALAGQLGHAPTMENHILIALEHQDGTVGYGPGSQLRLDMPAATALAPTHQRLRSLLSTINEVGASLGLAFSTIAFHPDRDPLATPMVTKRFYPALQKRWRATGTRGLATMTNAAQCSVKISVTSEADAVDKFRAGICVAPYLGALFANSPIDRGRSQSLQSIRTLGWLDTDRARTDFSAQAFAPDFSYAKYAAWALAVPALGLLRSGRVVDTAGRSFGDCLAHDNGGITPFPVDWHEHLMTLYPAVRWNDGVELRVTDTGTVGHALALAALWKGLLQSPQARAEVRKRYAPQAFGRTLQKCARDGLYARTEHGEVWSICQTLVRLAKAALPANEQRFLQPAELALAQRLSPADELRQRFGRDWKNIHELLLATRPES